MLRMLIAISVVFGMVIADPVGIHRSSKSDDSPLPLDYIYDEEPENQLARFVPDKTLLFSVLHALFGNKVSALSIAVVAIKWLVRNGIAIVIGAVAAYGFCKITMKCSLSHIEYTSSAQFRNMFTPEQLDAIDSFLLSAVEKYAGTQNEKELRNLWKLK